MLTLTFIGHSAFLLSDGATSLIIDPFLTGNPTASIAADDLRVQYIALTHAHGDHLGDAIELALTNDATIIAVNELANYCAGKGAKVHNMHIGGAFRFPFGRLKFTIAHHGSASPEGLYMGEPAGVLVTMGGKTVYHTGDTGLFLDMKLIGELDTIDCMCVPIGDNYTMGIEDAVRAVGFVRPALAIPMHYNTFPIIMADPEEFRRKVVESGFACQVVGSGQRVTLP
jgi:L-ascorbate metabolism protein UlaG (beta-lactamase superfamily)